MVPFACVDPGAVSRLEARIDRLERQQASPETTLFVVNAKAGVSGSRIQAIKDLRAAIAVGLKEATFVVDSAPGAVWVTGSQVEATRVQQALNGAGMQAEVRRVALATWLKEQFLAAKEAQEQKEEIGRVRIGRWSIYSVSASAGNDLTCPSGGRLWLSQRGRGRRDGQPAATEGLCLVGPLGAPSFTTHALNGLPPRP